MSDVKAPDSYFTGASGEDIVKHFLRQWRIACTSLEKSDFGEDILCDIFASSEDGSTNIRTNLSFRVQVKTTLKIENEGYIRRTAKGLSVSISSSLLELWGKSYYPVILVIWDLSLNKGFWCAPLEGIKTRDMSSRGTMTIHIDSSNDFQAGGTAIRNYVDKYYNNLLRLDNAKYRCRIYPLWMPRYQLFTSYELQSIAIKKKVDYRGVFADYLPTFLSSYNNLNLGAYLSCIEYVREANSINQYLSDLRDFLLGLPITTRDNSWASFIVSPIEIVASDVYRVVNEVTYWTSFSKIGNGLHVDHEYAFSLTGQYFYTEKVRASSADENFFIHDSGRFAVEILAKANNSFAQKSDDKLRHSMFCRSFCVWDVSNCTEEEIQHLYQWCKEKELNISFVGNQSDVVLISHQFFSPGRYCLFLPGMETWDKFYEINFRSEEFISQIPCGRLADDTLYDKVCKTYLLQDSGTASEIVKSYELALAGEALRHDERIIRLVCFVRVPADDFELRFKGAGSATEDALKNKFSALECFYVPHEDLNVIVLRVVPFYNMPTLDAVNIAEPSFLKLLDCLCPFINSSANTAYYIKYYLDQWLPEECVIR